MLTVLVSCPDCNKVRKAPQEQLGRHAKCPCGASFELKEWKCLECTQVLRDMAVERCPRCLVAIPQLTRPAPPASKPARTAGRDTGQSNDEWIAEKNKSEIAAAASEEHESEVKKAVNPWKPEMYEQYFLKLGTTVTGPFSMGQIINYEDQGHLPSGIEISNHQGGPWTCWSVVKQQQTAKRHDISQAEQIAEEVLDITPESETPATEPSDAPRTRECEDCGGVVSKRAATCPHCGAPTGSKSSGPQPSSSVNVVKPDEQWSETTHNQNLALCPHCNKTRSKNAKVCPHCGGSIPQPNYLLGLFLLVFVFPLVFNGC
jgi:hypothetical protein